MVFCVKTSDSVQYAFFDSVCPELTLSYLASCGEGVPHAELRLVLASMMRLGSDPDKKVESLRFWGKFFAMRGAYYIFECSMSERPEKVCKLLSFTFKQRD